MRFMLTPRKVQRHRRRCVSSHVFKAIFTSRSLQSLAPAVWNRVPVWILRKEGRAADSALPELCSCPGPDEFTYLNREPRLAPLLLLVPDGGKLIPSNVEKLTLHANSLTGFLAKAHLSWPHCSRLGGKEQKKWRFVHLGIFLVSEWPLARIMISQAPRECIPVLRAAGLESIKGSSPLPSAGVWGTSWEARGVDSNSSSASRFPQM